MVFTLPLTQRSSAQRSSIIDASTTHENLTNIPHARTVLLVGAGPGRSWASFYSLFPLSVYLWCCVFLKSHSDCGFEGSFSVDVIRWSYIAQQVTNNLCPAPFHGEKTLGWALVTYQLLPMTLWILHVIEDPRDVIITHISFGHIYTQRYSEVLQ